MRLLAIDIETTPNLVWTWGLRDQNIGLNQIEQTSRTLCFAAKWIGERGPIQFFSEWGNGDHGMVEAAHLLLDEADAVLHYNGQRFDVPHLKREFLEWGMAPPSPFKQIDLYRVAQQFRFQSHKLEHVSRQIGLGGKVEHEGFPLWRKAMAGDPKAQRKMERYNKQDVRLLEEAYELLLPWIPAHPSVPLHDGTDPDCCPRCGSCHVQRRGTVKTQVSAFQQFQCQSCRGWFRTNRRTRSVSRTPVAA